MTILTNWTFWVIVVAIIIIMAIIGYLAEGTELAKNPKEKKQKEQKKDESVIEPVEEISDNTIEMPIEETLTNEVIDEDNQTEDLNVEVESNLWSDDAPKIDERKETIHNVPTVDDWSVIPEDSNELPEVELEPITESQENTTTEEPMFPETSESDLEKTEILEPVNEFELAEPTIEPAEESIEELQMSEQTEENVWK